jgi:uncharacterized OsmC-like protein
VIPEIGPPLRQGADMSAIESAADNGVNTQALLDARAALVDAPAAAEFTWRATNEWLRGTHSKTTIQQYSGLGEDHNHKSTFSYDADHPEVFAAEDNAPTPVEFLLVGLASCLTAGVAAVAQNRGIQLESVKATVEGDMNVLGILGADPEVRNGYSNIRVNFDIKADASADDIAALVAQSQKRSAVFDALANPTNISVSVS